MKSWHILRSEYICTGTSHKIWKWLTFRSWHTIYPPRCIRFWYILVNIKNNAKSMWFFFFKDEKLSTGIYYLNQSTKFKHQLTWSCPKTIIKTPPSNVGWLSVFVITCWTCWKGKFCKKRQRKLSTVWPTLARNQDFY